MARTDMVIPEILVPEALRTTAEIIDVFNAASGGTVLLESRPAQQARQGGEYTESWRLKRPSGLVTHLDHTSGGSASTVALTMAGGSSVRWKGKIGPVKYTDDEVLTGAASPEAFSLALGRLFATEQLVKLRNLVIAAAAAAIDSADTTDGSTSSPDIHVLDVARGKTAGAKVKITLAYLNTLLGKMKDHREDIVALLMPSAVFTDLVGDQITNYKVDRIAGMLVFDDVPAAFGRKVIVADIPALQTDLTSSYYSEYSVLGLGRGALRAVICHEGPMEVQREILAEVPYTLVRRDFDVDVFIAGMIWSPASATPNPTDAQLATAANWDEDYEDHRDCPIVKGVFNAT